VKLVVPYIAELRPADARLIRLAEFLGIESISVPVGSGAKDGFWATDFAADDADCCFVVNPDVIRQSVHGDLPFPAFASAVTSRFHRILVHSVRSDLFHRALVSALTTGCFHDVRKPQGAGAFVIPPESSDVCEAFAGLSIPAPNSASQWVFVGGDSGAARKLITLGGEAFLAAFKTGDTEVLLLGSEDVANLDAEAGEAWLRQTFSSFVSYAMALRYIFGTECWRPAENHASVVVDDPLLRPNYGFLNFERLLRFMEEHNFETTIAFIPHNFRRNSQRIVRLFETNAHRFSLCFHGNDHIGAEFAATDSGLLNTMLQIAQQRMNVFGKMTGLPYDRVMVFPQGRFSVDAMAALKSQNFDAAVNTVPHPFQQPLQLTLRELAEPAVLRYSGFPLFLRKCSQDTQDLDIAFKLFFGIPILIVEHHNIFSNPQVLIDAVDRINRAAPGIRWSGAGGAVQGSYLRRQAAHGPVELRSYARRIRIKNPSSTSQQFQIEWNCLGANAIFDGVYRNDRRCREFNASETRVSVSAVIDAGGAESFSIRNVQTETKPARIGLRYSTRAFIRRRLSEVRDNYISKSPALLATAKSLQHRLQH
jgi:hypothetical protein